MHAVSGGAVPLHDYLSAEQRARGEALEHYLKGDMRAAVDVWESQPADPACPTELAVVAHAYAQLGNPKARSLAEQLRAFSPTEATAITAILLWRQRRLEAAGDAIQTTLRAMRTDPWTLPQLATALFQAAFDVAKKRPSLAQSLYGAIREPFAVAAFEDKRRTAAYNLARRVGPEAIAESLGPFEPHVPWKLPLLEARAHAYRTLGHPLAGKAQADLAWFQRHER
jgi:hypothetical protein